MLDEMLGDAQKRNTDADRARVQRVSEDVTGIQCRLCYNGRLEEETKTLLEWIEQRRTEMVAEDRKLIEEASDNQVAVPMFLAGPLPKIITKGSPLYYSATLGSRKQLQ